MSGWRRLSTKSRRNEQVVTHADILFEFLSAQMVFTSAYEEPISRVSVWMSDLKGDVGMACFYKKPAVAK